jgi:hypothetical protein
LAAVRASLPSSNAFDGSGLLEASFARPKDCRSGERADPHRLFDSELPGRRPVSQHPIFGGQDHPNPELYIFQSVGQSERDLILDEDRSAWNHRNLAVSPAQYAVVVAKLQQYAGDHPRVSCDVAGSHSRLVGGLSVRELNHDDSLGSVCMWAVGKPMFPLLKYIEEIVPETEDTNEWRQSTHHFFYVDERPWPLEPPFVP